ncbi:MAG: EF-hand domain-containing protein [Rhodospirillales bacterium]
MAGLRRAARTAVVTAAMVPGVWALSVAVAVGTPVAHAQTTTDFSAVDTNHDGRIDRGEYEKRMLDVFYLADTNKDGVLEVQEVVVAERGLFDRADANKDGKVTLREFLVVRMADFDAADTNHDGVLSESEVQAWEAR